MTPEQPSSSGPIKIIVVIAVLMLLSRCAGSDEAPQQIQMYKLI